jgi:hypothetical protein
MSAQPEALRLAEVWEKAGLGLGNTAAEHAAAELRRLHEVNADLLKALKEVVNLANDIYGHWYDDKESKVGKCLLALAQRLPKYDTRIDKIHEAIAKAEGRAATPQNDVICAALADMGRAAL